MHGCLSPLWKIKQCMQIISELLIILTILWMLCLGNNIKMYIFSKNKVGRLHGCRTPGRQSVRDFQILPVGLVISHGQMQGTVSVSHVFPVPISTLHQSRCAKSRSCEQLRVLTFSVRREHCLSSWLLRIRSTNVTSRKAQILK